MAECQGRVEVYNTFHNIEERIWQNAKVGLKFIIHFI